MANEEHTMNTITSLGFGISKLLQDIASAIQRYTDAKEQLSKYWEKGGELRSDIKIPRKMIAEFEDECTKKGIRDYIFRDTDARTEYVNVVYKGAEFYRKDEQGNYKKENGFRVGEGGDYKIMHEIAAKINAQYVERNEKSYSRSEMFDQDIDVREIKELSKTEATIFCEQLNKNWVENVCRLDKATGKYTVIVQESDMKRPARLGLIISPVERAYREMNFLMSDERVTRFIEDQGNINKELVDMINSQNIKELHICEPLNIYPRDVPFGSDFRDAEINIKNNIAEVYIKDGAKKFEIHEMLDITKENDRLRLYKDLSFMDGKALYSKEEYENLCLKHKNIEQYYFGENSREILDLTTSPHRLAALKQETEKFEKIINDRYHCSVAEFGAKHEGHEGVAKYEANKSLIEKVEHAIGECFTKEDIMLSEYKKAQEIDARVAQASEKHGMLNRFKEATMKETRIENSNIIMNYVATFTKEDVENVALADREIYDKMRENMRLRMNDTKVVLGERKISVGDYNTYGLGINKVSATAQEFAEFCEAYEVNGLEEEYDKPIDIEPGFSFNHPAAEELEDYDEDLMFADHDIDGDGDFDEGDWDSFGNDNFETNGVGILDSDNNPMDFDEEEPSLFI